MSDEIRTSFRNAASEDDKKKGNESSSAESDSEDIIIQLTQSFLEVRELAPPPYIGTGLIYDEIMTLHKCEWDPKFPENPLRITEPYKRCTELGLIDRCERLECQRAKPEEILTKHSHEHLKLAEKTVAMTLEERKELCQNYDAWYCNDYTYDAGLLAAGTTIKMVDDILHFRLSNGFAMIRPPGHHAMENEFNGYCTFNNVALAAQSALNKGVERILIVDWDVHHGQGIQRMFYDDPRVLYFSIHRYEHGRFWPELRESDYDHIGKDKGKGFNVNVPLNQTGMSNSDYMAVFNQILMPLAYEFNPQLVLVSSGYDAALGCPEFSPQLVLISNGLDSAIGDEKGEMLITAPMYAHMVHHLRALAKGRVCVALEGGYCIKSLSEGCALTLRSLLQDPCPLMPATVEPSDSIITTILNLVKVLYPHWKCFKHYQKLDKSEQCKFKEVNTTPPVEGVKFMTPENRPEKFKLTGYYPVQSEETKQKLLNQIDQIIRETNLSVAKTKFCYTYDAQMKAHKNIFSPSHPERPDRIVSIHKKLTQWNLLERGLEVPSRMARKSELLWIHTEEYITELKQTENMEEDSLNSFPDDQGYSSIYVNQKSFYSALLAAGSVLNVVEAVLTGQAQSGIAIVRPPGHHAECNKAMGFCFFNNVAVAAKFAQKNFKLKRILIVDWDVHHGNATQHQFYRDPSVLYISLHRFDNGHFFPGRQDAGINYVGQGPGEGYNVNIPWCGSRMGDAEYILAFTQIIMPIAYQYAPELVIISAGFDSAIGDPLGGYSVTPAGYAHMTHMLMGLANGKVILALEGGYNLRSIAESMAACTSVLLGDQCPALPSLNPNASAVSTVGEVLSLQKKYWSCLKFKERIPFDVRDQKLLTVPYQTKQKTKQGSARKAVSSVTLPSGDSTSTTDVSSISSQYPTTSSNSSRSAGTSSGFSSSDTSVSYGSLSGPPRSANVNRSNQLGDGSEKSGGEQPHDDDVISGIQNLTLSESSDVPATVAEERLWSDPDSAYDRVIGPAAELSRAGRANAKQEPIEPFRSAVYAQEDRASLSKFASSSQASSDVGDEDKEPEEPEASYYADREETIDFPSPDLPRLRSGKALTPDAARPEAAASPPERSQAQGGSQTAGGHVAGKGDEPLGACGGSGRPNTFNDLIHMQGVDQMYAIQPLPWCPHLTEVTPMTSARINTYAPCSTCGDTTENWICLTCYKVECSRFVNEHMLHHKLQTGHSMALSFSDLSIWCYACDNYVDNEVLHAIKSAAHVSKFGEPLPRPH